MAMVIDNKFDFGQEVYLKTDPEQLKRIVTQFSVTKNGIVYELSFGAIVSPHYDFEISTEKDTVIACV